MQSIIGTTTTRKPDIIFHSTGRIDIAAHVAKTLNLQHGDVIDIMLYGGEWYLIVRYRSALVVGRHKCTAFRSNKGGHHFRIWSKEHCTAILDYCQCTDRVKLCVGTPTEIPVYGTALPIIIKNILP